MKINLLTSLLIVSFIVIGCIPAPQSSCPPPPSVTEKDIFGKWEISYDNYWSGERRSGRVNGIETITFFDDFTYTQIFASPEFEHASAKNNWELLVFSDRGSALILSDLKYFATGVGLMNGPLLLNIQVEDAVRYQNDDRQHNADVPMGVMYPQSGHTYLYPRACSNELVLVQMVPEGQDPDELIIHSLFFTKVDG